MNERATPLHRRIQNKYDCTVNKHAYELADGGWEKNRLENRMEEGKIGNREPFPGVFFPAIREKTGV